MLKHSEQCPVHCATSSFLFVSIPPRVFSHHERPSSDLHWITSLAYKLFFPLPASLSTMLDRASLSTALATHCFCPSPTVPSYHHLSLGRLKWFPNCSHWIHSCSFLIHSLPSCHTWSCYVPISNTSMDSQCSWNNVVTGFLLKVCPWNLLEIHNLGPHHKPVESEFAF